MRYIAIKNEDSFEITHINFMERPNGEKVEVIMGKTKADKNKLIETIKSYKEETEAMLKQRNEEIEELNKILEAINDIK